MTSDDKNSSNSNLTFSKRKVVKTKLATAVGDTQKKYANGFDRPSVLLDLEPRMMFDGAAPLEADQLLGESDASAPEALPAPEVAASEITVEADGIADSLELSESEQQVDMVSHLDAEQALQDDGAMDESSLASESGELSLSNEVVMDEVAYLPIESMEADLDAQEQELLEEQTEELDDADESEMEEVVVEEQKVARVVFIDTSVSDYEDLLNGVVSEIEMGAEEDEVNYVASVDAGSVSSEYDVANPSTAPPLDAEVENDAVSESVDLVDAGYSVNEDGACRWCSNIFT